MKRTLALIAVSILAMTLAACGGERAGAGPSGEETILYSSGGGFDGEGLRLEIQPDGSATATRYFRGDERAREFSLGRMELDALRDELAEVDLSEIDEGRSDECFDCIGYEIAWGDERAAADSSTISDDFTDAVEILSRVRAGS